MKNFRIVCCIFLNWLMKTFVSVLWCFAEFSTLTARFCWSRLLTICHVGLKITTRRIEWVLTTVSNCCIIYFNRWFIHLFHIFSLRLATFCQGVYRERRTPHYPDSHRTVRGDAFGIVTRSVSSWRLEDGSLVFFCHEGERRCPAGYSWTNQKVSVFLVTLEYSVVRAMVQK